MKSESVDSHPAGDWDTPYRSVPDASVGEFSRVGANPVVADTEALSFSETSRTPSDGFVARDQGAFPTTNSKKRS